MKKWRVWFGGSDRKTSAIEPPIDLASPEFFRDPAPIYAELRRNHPVASVAGGGYILTRHKDIVSAFSNPALGNAPSRFSVLGAQNRGKYTAAELASRLPPFLDKPDHIDARRRLSSAFYEVYSTVPEWIDETAQEYILSFSRVGADLIADIARPYVCAVMARFVGVPNDPAAIKDATEGFFHLFAPIVDRDQFAAVNSKLDKARAFIGRGLDCAPNDNTLLHMLIAKGMSEDVAIDNALLVLADGVENIEAAIAMSFDILTRNAPERWDGSIDQAAVDECLRLSTPGQIIPRVARQDLTLHGIAIARGMPVFLALGSANLDEDIHDNPLEFRLDRQEGAALSFGLGRHACIGAPLGRIQIMTMLNALIAAGIERADDDPLSFHHRFGHRWPKAMQVRLNAVT